MGKVLSAVVLLLGVVFSAPKLVIKDAWIAEPPPGPDTTLMGMTIINEGDEGDKLIRAETPVAKKVELHKTVMEGDVAKMIPQKAIPIPPKEKVEFGHHGYHIMLIGLKEELRAGDKVKVKLLFEKSGEVELEVPVVGLERMEKHQERHEMMHH